MTGGDHKGGLQMTHVDPAKCGFSGILAICTVTLAMHPASSHGQYDVARGSDSHRARPQPDLTVYEGVGVGQLQLGDPAENLDQILGDADAGSENHRKYSKIGLTVQLCEGKVFRISFHKAFAGRLFTSGLRMGSSLEEVERSYGPILERREVQDHNAWTLDRVLLIRRNGPQSKEGPCSKLHYYDLGMYFYFDEHGLVCAFGLSRRTGYALRAPEERIPLDGPRPGVPSFRPPEPVVSRGTWDTHDLRVHEGVGLGDLEFGDPADRVESVLGPPDSGSEGGWHYPRLGITVALVEGRAWAFYFSNRFAGKLVGTGLGIGDHLEDVEAAYGEALGRREVESLSDWTLDRVLLVCEACKGNSQKSVARLRYGKVGLYLDFDKDDRVVAFGLTRRTVGAQRTGVGSTDNSMAHGATFAAESVFEGEGFAGLRLNDPAERVEQILGAASGGCKHALRFKSGHFTVQLRDGKIKGFCFQRGFSGTLNGSGLGIGDTLDDVVYSYGESLAVRQVENLCDWHLDRTLLVLSGSPSCPDAPVAKICYSEHGVCFDLDADDRVSGFGILVPTPEPKDDVPGETDEKRPR